MNRLVQGSDGRDWAIRAQMEWRRPATADDFEHDVAATYAPGIFMFIVALILGIVIFVWMPDGVVVPSWVVLAVLLVILFFPMRWIMRRPWTIVAETEGDATGERPSERWVGTIRGILNVRGEVKRIGNAIKKYNIPDFDGPLHPVE